MLYTTWMPCILNTWCQFLWRIVCCVDCMNCWQGLKLCMICLLLLVGLWFILWLVSCDQTTFSLMIRWGEKGLVRCQHFFCAGIHRGCWLVLMKLLRGDQSRNSCASRVEAHTLKFNLKFKLLHHSACQKWFITQATRDVHVFSCLNFKLLGPLF